MAGTKSVGGAQWRKSSRSGSANCVEVAFADGHEVFVRDSKDPGGGVLRFTSEEWGAFLAGVRHHEFDG